MSYSEWTQGGGLKHDPAYQEMLRLEKEALVKRRRLRESTREACGQAPELLSGRR